MWQFTKININNNNHYINNITYLYLSQFKECYMLGSKNKTNKVIYIILFYPYILYEWFKLKLKESVFE